MHRKIIFRIFTVQTGYFVTLLRATSYCIILETIKLSFWKSTTIQRGRNGHIDRERAHLRLRR